MIGPKSLASHVFGTITTNAAIYSWFLVEFMKQLAIITECSGSERDFYMNYENSGSIVEECALEALEARLGYKLPVDYKFFLRQTNGGKPSPSSFMFYRTGSNTLTVWTWVGLFLRLGQHVSDLKWGTVQEYIRHNAGLRPHGFLPIASLTGQERLLLDCRPRVQGAVWIQDGELCETDDERGGGCFFVAESFAAFVAMLTQMPDGAKFETPVSSPVAHRPIPPLPPGVRLPLWIDRGEQLTAAEVAQIGEDLGVELPAPYAAFLAEHNGGRPTRHLFDVPGVDDPEARVLDVHVLLRGIRAENREVGLEFANCDEDVADPGMIVIGLCDRRRTIWLCCEGPRAGQVWRREIEMEVEGDEEGGWRKLADSFEAFVGGLRE